MVFCAKESRMGTSPPAFHPRGTQKKEGHVGSSCMANIQNRHRDSKPATKHLDTPGKRAVAFQNADWNSPRNRVSFSENRRRSLTRYFRLVMRSTPMPKA